MSGARRWWLALLVAIGVAAWRFWPSDDSLPQQLEVGGAPTIERGVRRAVAVTQSERVDEEWTKKNAEAIRLLGTGDFEGAVALFAECVAGDPTEDVFRANLAEALARLARMEYEIVETRLRAIGHLEQAVEFAPERADLAELLQRWKATAEVEEDFWTDHTAHFRLSYDGDREELLSGGYDLVLQTLEDAYAEYAELFGVRLAEGGAPAVEVVLLEREEFDDLTGLGHWAGGAYDGRIRVPVTDLDTEQQRLIRVLRHELVHAFVQEAGGRGVAGWLNEGLAEFLEEPAGAARAAAIERSRQKVSATAMRSLKELSGSLSSLGGVDEIRAAYAQSVSFVAWIEHWYGERVLFQMVEGCRDGAKVGDTFKERTRTSLEAVLEDLAQDLSQ